MNYIAAMLLLCLELSEERAFWVMVALIDDNGMSCFLHNGEQIDLHASCFGKGLSCGAASVPASSLKDSVMAAITDSSH